MAGYGVQERNLEQSNPNPHQCGACGNRVPKNETLCRACKEDVLYKVESGESQ